MHRRAFFSALAISAATPFISGCNKTKPAELIKTEIRPYWWYVKFNVTTYDKPDKYTFLINKIETFGALMYALNTSESFPDLAKIYTAIYEQTCFTMRKEDLYKTLEIVGFKKVGKEFDDIYTDAQAYYDTCNLCMDISSRLVTVYKRVMTHQLVEI